MIFFLIYLYEIKDQYYALNSNEHLDVQKEINLKLDI